MLRSLTIMALILFATTSLALATTPAEPLPPLRPTKAPTQAQEVKPEDSKSRRKTFTTTTPSTKAAKARLKVKALEDVPPETGTKGRVHVPSKAVKHESAKNPANQKAPAPPGPYDAPYNN